MSLSICVVLVASYMFVDWLPKNHATLLKIRWIGTRHNEARKPDFGESLGFDCVFVFITCTIYDFI
jgi:hypothetical protein